MFGFKSNQRLELSKIIWANKIWRSCIILRWSWVAKVVLGSCMGQVWVKYECPKCQVSHWVWVIPPGFGGYPTSSLALFLAHFFRSFIFTDVNNHISMHSFFLSSNVKNQFLYGKIKSMAKTRIYCLTCNFHIHEKIAL